MHASSLPITHTPARRLLAALAVLLAGCASKPTDATATAIADTQAASERAGAHLDKAIDLNVQMQRALNDLRQYRPAGAK